MCFFDGTIPVVYDFCTYSGKHIKRFVDSLADIYDHVEVEVKPGVWDSAMSLKSNSCFLSCGPSDWEGKCKQRGCNG